MSQIDKRQIMGQMASKRHTQASNGLWNEQNLLDSQDGGLPIAADRWYSVSKVLARWLHFSLIMAGTATRAMTNAY